MKATEHDIQSAFFDWLKLQKIDGVELAFAVPNGGARHKKTAGMLKAEGVKAGVPDVLWPVSRGGFSGLAIEFKANDGTPTAEQRRMIDGLQKQGWCAVMCWDWQAAARVFTGYAGMTQIAIASR